MTTQEQIAVMQAYVDGKNIQSRNNFSREWTDIVGINPQWNWGIHEYRIKPEPILPKTWEEFCKKHHTKKNESFIDTYSNIREIGEGGVRQPDIDANLLPNKKIAEAMLALCKLIRLRDCYNDGWQPDWSDETIKYIIYFYDNKIDKGRNVKNGAVLAFYSEELRDKFAENFRELIDIAKPLL